MDNGKNINPFTGMSNDKSMKLQNTWENILANEIGKNYVFNFNDVDSKLKKLNLCIDTYKRIEFGINCEQMCPSAHQFQFDIKV